MTEQATQTTQKMHLTPHWSGLSESGSQDGKKPGPLQ
jgi:hypothetical protein